MQTNKSHLEQLFEIYPIDFTARNNEMDNNTSNFNLLMKALVKTIHKLETKIETLENKFIDENTEKKEKAQKDENSKKEEKQKTKFMPGRWKGH
jgi:hypothetical protein